MQSAVRREIKSRSVRERKKEKPRAGGGGGQYLADFLEANCNRALPPAPPRRRRGHRGFSCGWFFGGRLLLVRTLDLRLLLFFLLAVIFRGRRGRGFLLQFILFLLVVGVEAASVDKAGAGRHCGRHVAAARAAEASGDAREQ
jgi:hypothetical protein